MAPAASQVLPNFSGHRLMKTKLDAKTVPGLALADGQSEAFFWDTELEGFGLRLRRRRGAPVRKYVAQYRVAGRSRRVTIGSADKLTLGQAREAARKLLAKVALGHDPQAEREAKRQQQARTFKSVVADYLDAKQPQLRQASFRVSRLYLAGPYFRPLHPVAINAITRTDVAACVRAVSRSHSSITAGAARRALSALFAWAIADGLLGDGANPVDGSHRPADSKPRDHVLTDAELVNVWKACGDGDYGRIVRLLILTGARRQEVGGLQWAELDLDKGEWRLPKERSKNGREHAIALAPEALAILSSVLRGGDYLFGHGSAGFSPWAEGKRALDGRLSGTVRPWRLHDIRRSVATKMADVGIEPHVIEACLNHYGGHRSGIAGTYNRSNYERATAAAFARWAERLMALVEGRDSKVIPLRA